MPIYSLSVESSADIKKIYSYSYSRFGRAQAVSYLRTLEYCFNLIAERPRLGRLRPDIDEQVRSFVHKAHIIYYEPHVNGVLILRVLHGAQDPVRHFPDMPERG